MIEKKEHRPHTLTTSGFCTVKSFSPPTKESKQKLELELFRTRWRRWLGNKTRTDKPYWSTLLNSNWVGWAQRTREKHELDHLRIYVTIPREDLKAIYLDAINNSDMSDLQLLDEIYCCENLL